ncbi:MAG: hypothetical protein ABSC55_20620 [Syntrophorhabdales bacterium]|jgi:hypothetical protein
MTEIKEKKSITNDALFCIDNKPIVIAGKWIKVAAVHDEDWLAGQVIDNPESFISKLKESELRADIFTFAQKIPDCKPRYKFNMEWGNAAAIPITTYQEWWGRVPSDLRKDVRRAQKRGLVIEEVALNDELIRGVVEMNNETPIRQGRRFVHYGLDFETVKKGYSTYLDRSAFIGAFYENELVGIIKMVYVGELACLMEILSKIEHYDKRPTNALIAKAVEICDRERKSYLTFGRYYYGNKEKSSIVDFKRRNGFERIIFPRYYVPLTAKGRVAVKLKLQLGLLGILPGTLISVLVNLRSHLHRRALARGQSTARKEDRVKDEKTTEMG